MLVELRTLLKAKTALIVVDDAHLLDRNSAAFLLQVALTRACAIVFTARDAGAPPDAVSALWKDGIADRIDLLPLSRAGSQLMVEAAIRGRLSASAAARIFALTLGNPWHTRLLVEGSMRSGDLREMLGVWRWRPDAPVAPTLLQLMEQRITIEGTSAERAMRWLAAAEPLPADVLVELAGSRSVEAAETAGLIQLEQRGRGTEAHFAHPLFGEVIRSRTATTTLRRLKGELAARLAPYGNDEALRRGVLTLESGERDPDPALLTLAAHHAIAAFDLRLAERLAAAAMEAGGGAEAAMVRTMALTFASDGAAAEKMLTEVIPLLPAGVDREVAIAVRVANLLFSSQRPTTALAVARAGLEENPGSPTLRAAESCVEAFADPRSDTLARATQLGRDGTGTPTGDLLSLWARLVRLCVTGRVTAADADIERGYGLMQSADLINARFGYADVHLTGLRLSGRGTALAALADRADLVSAGTVEPFAFYGDHLTGIAAAYRGDLLAALPRLTDECAGLMGVESGGILYRSLVVLTQVHGMRGDADAAARALVTLREHEHPSHYWCRPEFHLAQTWVHAAAGRIEAAIQQARLGADLAAASDAGGYVLLALSVAARLGDDRSAVELGVAAQHMQTPAADRCRRLSAALARRDGDALAELSFMEEADGDRVAAADYAALSASLLVKQRHGARAGTLAARAAALAARAGADTPALRALAPGIALPPRERQIAELVSRGESNREIAHRLGLSVRTVEGHVYRLMGRLDVGTRGELKRLWTAHIPASSPEPQIE